MSGRSPLRGSGLRPSGAEPQDASQAEPLVPNAEVVRLKSEIKRLQAALGVTRAIAKAAGRNMLREEADESLHYFTPQWEPLRDIAMRGEVKSAAWLASRARDLQKRDLVESKWIGSERTQFKLWRLKGRPVPIHASGPASAMSAGTAETEGLRAKPASAVGEAETPNA